MRLVKFVDFCGKKVQSCATSVGDGVSVSEKVLVTVSKYLEGQTMEPQDYQNKAIVHAVGTWLAQFHEASRQFAKENPTDLVKVQNWNSGDHAWQGDDLKPPNIPVTESTFGVIHGDFNFQNFNYSVDQQNSLKIGVFDWEASQMSWFLMDLGQLVFEASHQLWDLQDAKHITDAQRIKLSQQFVDWLCDGYSSAGLREKVNREHLRQCADFRRDYQKCVFIYFIKTSKGDPETVSYCQAFVQRVESGGYQHYDVCRVQRQVE